MKKKTWKGLSLVAFLTTIMCVFGFTLMHEVKAEPTEQWVEPGAGTLKEAVESAPQGAILKLRAGSYTGKTDTYGKEIEEEKIVHVKHSITIDGAGMFDNVGARNSMYTTVSVPFVIEADTEDGKNPTVTFKNFSSSNQSVPHDFVLVKVEKPTNLNMENVENWGIARDLHVKGAGSLLLDTGANGSVVNLNRTLLDRFGTSFGIDVKSSNTTIKVENNSAVYGRTAINLDGGSGNNISISDSRIEGRDIYNTEANVIEFNNQSNTSLNISNCNINGNNPSGDSTSNVVYFKGSNSGVTVNLKDVKITENNDADKSTIFNFGESTHINNNVITMNNSSSITFKEGNLSLDNKYNKSDKYAVVGIYDKEGNSEIKVYDNDTAIKELESKSSLEGYKFKGWFKQYDGATTYSEEYVKDPDDGYPKAASNTNMDLYPKFVKEVKVTIGKEGKPHTIEEGQTLDDILDVDTELEALKKEGQNLKGYIMHGVTGSSMSVTAKTVEELKKIKITEDVTVEAVHTVTLTVNDKEFELDSGDTVEKIETHDGYTGTKAEYKSAKLNNKDDLHFSRLVYDGTKDTFDENTPITSNTKVITKHYAVVTLGSDSETKYRVEEGEKISTGTKYLDDNTKLVDTLKAIKEAPVEDKSFSRFVDSDNTTINLEGEEESKISKDTNIKAIYSIKVQIGENDPFTIDEGGSLKDLKEDAKIEGQLNALVDAVKDKTFTGFWVSVTGKEDKELVESSAVSPDDAITTILEKALSKNTTIYADFQAKVTICPDKSCESDKKEFTIDSGKTLKDVESKYPTDFEKAKYQKYSGQSGKDDRFSRFVDIDGTTFEETAEIEKDITLIPKYYAYVTIDDERKNVKGQYKVEEGKSISDIETDEGKLALATLRSNIETLDDDTGEGEELHFDKLVDSNGRDVDTTVTGDITIKGLYHYDVDIIEDYDDPHNTSGVDGHEGFAGFIVYRNENLKTSKESDGQLEKVNAALDKLMASVNKDDTRKFKAYKETNTNKIYDRDALLDEVFNYHININALVAYKVKVGEDVEDFVVEGDTISNSESNLLVDAINNLKTVSNKEFDKYVINEEEKDDIPVDTVINEYTEISAKYNVRIKIGEDDDTGYLIPEGKTLSSLPPEEQTEVKEKLEALQKKEGFNFDGYSVGEKTVDDVMKKEFNQNTTIVPKFNIIVTINCPNNVCSENGQKTFQLATGDTIKTIDDTELNKIKNAEKESKKVFNRFVGEDGNTFSEDTQFEKNTTLTAKYAYEVTIDVDDDTKYKVEEGTAINDEINAKLKAKLDELENVEGKTFDRFINADTSESIDRTVAGQINKPTKIKPIYSVTVTINGSEFKVDEGGSLKDEGAVKNALDALKDASGKEFDKYVVDGKEELTREALLEKKFNSNASVTAKYNVRIKTKEDDAGFLIPEGSKFSDITKDKLESVTKTLPEGKSSFAYFVDESGSKIDDNYTFNNSMTITPKYNVKITIEGIGYTEVLEGSKLFSATELIDKLNSNSDKRFNSFEDGTTLESTVDKSIDLVPFYEIDITIRTGNEEKKYTFVLKDDNEDGVPVSSLTTCGDKHLRFEENGEKVDESTKFNKHTNLVEIYKVEVTVDGETFTFESGNTLSSNILSPEQMGILNGKLSALRTSLDGIRGFSRFVDKQTGETIDERDFKFIQDTEIIPKYNVILTVVRKDDNGNEIDVVEIQLGEGLTISELKEEEYKKLQEKLDEVVKELEKEGKVNWAFSKFLDEEGNEVDLKNTKIDKDSKLIAVFEEKKPDTPDLGEITGNNSNNDKQPSKVAVPDTAGGENNIVTTIIDVILFMLSILLISGPVVMYKTIKVKNK